MDQVADRAAAVRGVMERVAGWLDGVRKPGVETVLLDDPGHGAYALMRVGWHAGKRLDNVVLMARVKGDKVWIEQDNTDLSFADELLAAGVPREDIVLGFLSPEERRYSDFAVA